MSCWCCADEINCEVDHSFTEEVVCPYCGNVFGDSFEYDDTDSDTCPECGKEFTLERETTYTYTTWRKKEK